MNILDIIIIVVFAGSIIYGLYKGIISQLGSLGGIILGIVACRIFGDDATRLVSDILPAMTSNASSAAFANSVIANILLFLIVYFLVKLLSGALKKLTHALALGFIDRILGAAFGLFKWCLALSIALDLWMAIFPDSTIIKASTLADGMAAKTILDLAPTLFGSIIPM